MPPRQSNTDKGQTTIAAAALVYARRGWKPVPLNRKSKKPVEKGWKERPYAPAQFNGNSQNIAVQLGEASGGLCDVDLDCMDAIGLAPEFLPATGAIFGRPSKPCSHQLYVSDLCDTETTAAIALKQYHDGKAGPVIVELRIGANGKGAHTTVPPSMHVTGELVQWVSDGEPARVAGAQLKRSVLELAVAALLKPRYPGQGSRQEAALVLGGVLARAGWDAERITHVVEVLARAAGDDEVRQRVEAAIGAIALKANGGQVPGLPRLSELWARTPPTLSPSGAWRRRAAARKVPASRTRSRSYSRASTLTTCTSSPSHRSGCAGPTSVGRPRTRSPPSTRRASCAVPPATAAPGPWPPW
jgi:hypothetical protein